MDVPVAGCGPKRPEPSLKRMIVGEMDGRFNPGSFGVWMDEAVTRMEVWMDRKCRRGVATNYNKRSHINRSSQRSFEIDAAVHGSMDA